MYCFVNQMMSQTNMTTIWQCNVHHWWSISLSHLVQLSEAELLGTTCLMMFGERQHLPSLKCLSF